MSEYEPPKVIVIGNMNDLLQHVCVPKELRDVDERREAGEVDEGGQPIKPENHS